ncbi:amino acid adenylation domain-containing protein [Massilia atriviolacea]|uniref:Non-ribosomal peptide synthetase n=1 Tax=Massilia atriviolacea TaxID=2495579 RepID=A0A430HSC9_9BURK|nr:amino acid adenylation domain-containing protein [Massilia atriviolacea]RSZ60394.1 non-ribosomal peptide synthetase [Massilia atriviolacea]
MGIAGEENAVSHPFSAEQRALLGKQEPGRLIHVLRLKAAPGVTPDGLRAAVERALQPHLILASAIAPVAGYRGLRMLALDSAAPVAWQTDATDAVMLAPLALERGELVRAAVADGPVLVLAVSALVADRGSLAALCGQIARASAPEDVFQYPHYIEWRQSIEQDDEEQGGAGRDYWRRYLQGSDNWQAPRLAGRRPGSRMPATPRHVVAARVDADTAGAIGMAADMVLQGAWWALLARLTGDQHLAGGWQHDCRRDYAPMQGALGVFDKILPFFIDGSADESFTAWMARMAAVSASHLEAQELCPIEALSGAAHTLVGFTVHDAPDDALPWQVLELPGPMPCFELALQADLSSAGLTLSLHADTALYSRRSAERLLALYLNFLREAVLNPDIPVGDLAWLDEAERKALLEDAAGPAFDVGPHSIAQRVAHWAGVTPDAPAVADAGRTWSYAQLDARANRLAHGLRARGLAAGSLLALELPRSPELIVAILAAWRLGAGYVPLEPAWPAARRHAVLADAAPALVLRAEAADDAGPCPQALLGDFDLESGPGAAPDHAPQAGELAYVLYTSGSTGQPKGVPIEQAQLLNYVAAASDAMELARCRRWALASSVAADLGNTSLFGALFNGACLVVADAQAATDPAAFARFIAAQDIDAIKIVPSHLEALLEGEGACVPATLVLGGEAAPRALIERIAQLDPGAVVYNHYGPTETTVGVMLHRVDPGQTLPDVLPLTRVLANNRVHVLDARLEPVPAGAMGELYVGGAQLCRGYLNRAADGVFVAAPWDGERLYRTGDLAWVLPDGGVRLAGRRDHQVKIRGFRVEPAEVETALLGLPGVRQAAVLARAGNAGAELAAFVAGHGELAHWRAQLARQLPEHMVPAGWTLLGEFPRLANGKIDRRALAEMPDAAQPQGAGAQPQDALEALLGGAMAGLLGRAHIAADADFFDEGGHSLLVIRLVARLRKLLDIEVVPGLVFDHPTPQALAAALCAGGEREALLARAQHASNTLHTQGMPQ